MQHAQAAALVTTLLGVIPAHRRMVLIVTSQHNTPTTCMAQCPSMMVSNHERLRLAGVNAALQDPQGLLATIAMFPWLCRHGSWMDGIDAPEAGQQPLVQACKSYITFEHDGQGAIAHFGLHHQIFLPRDDVLSIDFSSNMVTRNPITRVQLTNLFAHLRTIPDRPIHPWVCQSNDHPTYAVIAPDHAPSQALILTLLRNPQAFLTSSVAKQGAMLAEAAQTMTIKPYDHL